MPDLSRIFEVAETLLHDTVDHMLGDVVEVSNDQGPWTERKCFVGDENGVLNLNAIDSIDYRVRLKIRKEHCPMPSRGRFRGGKLGNRVWTISGDLPEQIGLYFVFDISLGA